MLQALPPPLLSSPTRPPPEPHVEDSDGVKCSGRDENGGDSGRCAGGCNDDDVDDDHDDDDDDDGDA